MGRKLPREERHRLAKMERQRKLKKGLIFAGIGVGVIGLGLGIALIVDRIGAHNKEQERLSKTVVLEEEFVQGECYFVSEGNYTVTFSGLIRNNTDDMVTAKVSVTAQYSYGTDIPGMQTLEYTTGMLLPGKRTTYMCVGTIPYQLTDYSLTVTWSKA